MAMQLEEYEKELTTSLARMCECLRSYDDWWSDKMNQAAVQTQELFSREVDFEAKYGLLKYIQGYYGGMGSLNDIELPDQCVSLKQALYNTIKTLLRLYWKELGREWYDYSKFDILPNETRVRLVPGKTVCYERDDSPSKVPQGKQVTNEVWVIVRCDGPDVTNMPSYLIRSGNRLRSARQEALEVIKNKTSFIDKLLRQRAI